MSFPTIADARIEVDKPFDEQMAEDLFERDEHLKSVNASGNADLVLSKYGTGHSHNGDPFQGDPIPEAGIADEGIWKSDYLAPGSVNAGKVKNNTVGTSDFANQAVPHGKLTGSSTTGMGTGQLTGTAISGGPATISHGLNKRPVVVNIVATGPADGYWIEWTSNTQIKIRTLSLATINFSVAAV